MALLTGKAFGLEDSFQRPTLLPLSEGQAIVGASFTWLEDARRGCISDTGLTQRQLGELNRSLQWQICGVTPAKKPQTALKMTRGDLGYLAYFQGICPIIVRLAKRLSKIQKVSSSIHVQKVRP